VPGDGEARLKGLCGVVPTWRSPVLCLALSPSQNLQQMALPQIALSSNGPLGRRDRYRGGKCDWWDRAAATLKASDCNRCEQMRKCHGTP